MPRRSLSPRGQPAPGPARWGTVGWKVMLHLLKERPTVPSARELARQLKVGHSQVSSTLSFLTFHRALIEGPRGLVVEWDQLARIVGALRLPDIVPARAFDASMSQRDFQQVAGRKDVPFAFGFTTAANILAYFEPHPEVCVVVDRNDVARALSMFRGAETGTIRGRRPIDKRNAPRFLVFADKLDRLDLVESPHGRITSLHQTFVDLLHFPLAAAHADFLRKAIDARWQREHPDQGVPATR